MKYDFLFLILLIEKIVLVKFLFVGNFNIINDYLINIMLYKYIIIVNYDFDYYFQLII